MTARLVLSALIIVGTWLDVASTLYGYRKYGLAEAGPIWGDLFTRPVLFYVLQTAFWGLMIAVMFAGRAALDMFIVLCVVRFGVVAWNARQIWKARRGQHEA